MCKSGETRQLLLAQCEDRLIYFADRALNHHQMNCVDFVLLCAKVDSTWRPLVDRVMPGYDWQRIRDTGVEPIALGIVTRAVCDIVLRVLPDLAVYLVAQPKPGWAQVIALDDHGGTVADVPSRSSLAAPH